jgi:hypothetical protein
MRRYRRITGRFDQSPWIAERRLLPQLWRFYDRPIKLTSISYASALISMTDVLTASLKQGITALTSNVSESSVAQRKLAFAESRSERSLRQRPFAQLGIRLANACDTCVTGLKTPIFAAVFHRIALNCWAEHQGRPLIHFGPLCASHATLHRERHMSSRYLLFVIVVGGLAHLILYLADREISAGIDRLSEATLARPESLNANPNLKFVSARSRYMRNER